MPLATFQELYRTWEALLHQNGFTDIEDRARDQSGQVLTTFKDQNSSYSLGQAYNASTEEYFRICKEYARVAKWALYGTNLAQFYKFLFTCHADGLSYLEISKVLKGKKLAPHIHITMETPKSKPDFTSVFYIFKQFQVINKRFYAYVRRKYKLRLDKTMAKEHMRKLGQSKKKAPDQP